MKSLSKIIKEAKTQWYVQDEKNGFVTLYGPYPSREEAEKANYFFKSPEERDSEAKKGKRMSSYFASGVNGYDENEIKSITNYPSEVGWKSVKVKPANSTPRHIGWKQFDQRQSGFSDFIMKQDLGLR